jgi:diadenylate cyclase
VIEGLVEYLKTRDSSQLLRDSLDVLLVYYVVYRALLVLRGTRAMQVGLGLGMVFVLYLVAQTFQLITVLSILSALISSIILVIVVVFQSDIRRGLMRVGSRAWLGSFARAKESKVIDEVVEAATELARHRIGAIVAFEQDANLDEFVGVHKGHLLDSAVSSELLVSLFIPEAINKLHDGAVIIRNYRIAKAGVFFPMPESRIVDESFGSRHRAALGITEETDAVVVIVSEERGTISFCFNGNIASNLDGPKLRTMLEAIFSPKLRKKKRKPGARPSLLPPEVEPPSERVSKLPTADKTPRPFKPTEAESTPRPSRDEETVPLRARPSREEAPPNERDSEPPPPLRPRLIADTEAAVASASAPRVAAAPAPLRQPAAGRSADSTRSSGVALPTETGEEKQTSSDDVERNRSSS